jgi:hypothetical protein
MTDSGHLRSPLPLAVLPMCGVLVLTLIAILPL